MPTFSNTLLLAVLLESVRPMMGDASNVLPNVKAACAAFVAMPFPQCSRKNRKPKSTPQGFFFSPHQPNGVLLAASVTIQRP